MNKSGMSGPLLIVFFRAADMGVDDMPRAKLAFFPFACFILTWPPCALIGSAPCPGVSLDAPHFPQKRSSGGIAAPQAAQMSEALESVLTSASTRGPSLIGSLGIPHSGHAKSLSARETPQFLHK
jgi:hypothetical protein